MKHFSIGLVLLFYFITQINSVPRYSFMQANNINTIFINNGIFNYDKFTIPGGDAGFIWPVSSPNRLTAVFASGIWIGAKVGPQSELRMAVCAYSSQFTPGNIPIAGQPTPQSVCDDTTWRGYLVQLTDLSLVNGGVRTKSAGGRFYTFVYDAWANWPIAKGAPYAEINGIPGYQPGWNSDRPGIGNGSKARPDELLYMVYMDYTNCTNQIHVAEISLPGGTMPLGVEIHQLSFMFNCPALINTYYVKYYIINKSSLTWDSTYITLFNDIDIGDGACGASDDGTGCDTLKNCAFEYNADNFDCNHGVNPPALGTTFMQSPLRFTGNNSDTAKLPYDTLIGYKLLGVSSYIYFVGGSNDTCSIDPFNANQAYNYMNGINACGQPYI